MRGVAELANPNCIHGVAVAQGQVIGLLGDTGLVAGAACADHPGTHLHFAMDTVNGDGTFSAYDPEPISGYSGVTAGKWYLSDNGTTTMATTVSVATTVAVTTPTSSTNIVFSGGFSVAPAVITASPTSSSEAADDNTTSTSVIVDASSTATTTTTTTSSTTSTATSTATSTGPAFGLNSSASVTSYQVNADPNTTAAWTVANLNAALIGYEEQV